ncbi:hypothetical protein FRC11_013418, partial [Ceratobasidium sp. 423]
MSGFDIASLTLTLGQIGAKVAKPFVKAATKEAAKESYNSAAQDFSRARKLRDDIFVNQYLSEEEKAQIDGAIERLVFNLMALEQVLKKVNNIAAWRILSYSTELQNFNERRREFTEEVEILSQDIYTRSSQARERAMEMKTAAAQSQLTATRVVTASDSNLNGDSDTLHDMLDALQAA